LSRLETSNNIRDAHSHSIDAIKSQEPHGKRYRALTTCLIISDKLALPLCHQHIHWELD
jgi:hypothetical protein